MSSKANILQIDCNANIKKIESQRLTFTLRLNQSLLISLPNILQKKPGFLLYYVFLVYKNRESFRTNLWALALKLTDQGWLRIMLNKAELNWMTQNQLDWLMLDLQLPNEPEAWLHELRALQQQRLQHGSLDEELPKEARKRATQVKVMSKLTGTNTSWTCSVNLN